jgi:PAS domain-containing protein
LITDGIFVKTKAFYAYGLVFPITGIDGEMLGYVKILRDLTERKNAEDSIKKSCKRTGRIEYT